MRSPGPPLKKSLVKLFLLYSRVTCPWKSDVLIGQMIEMQLDIGDNLVQFELCCCVGGHGLYELGGNQVRYMDWKNHCRRYLDVKRFVPKAEWPTLDGGDGSSRPQHAIRDHWEGTARPTCPKSTKYKI